MLEIEDIKEKLNNMLTKKRLDHSINVSKCAIKLSEIYGVDKEKAYIAGLVHDCAKCLTKEQSNFYVNKLNISLDEFEKNDSALSHSILGAYIAKYEFKIDNQEIINAIKYHTTGRSNMGILEKIIYIADLIEENRNFPGVDELRNITFNEGLDQALLKSFNNTIKFVIDKNKFIHPRTIEARNYIIKKRKN